MSTRSRANPWFRPVVPIANAMVDGIEADARFETKMRPIIVEADGTEHLTDERYDEMCRALVRVMVRTRLDNKLVLTARLLDPAFDERCREICPELPPLDPVTTGELRKER
jgi:hypothetical protein